MLEREKVISIEVEEEKKEKKVFISPLDRRDGRVPSWTEISDKYNLGELPRGEKKLFHSYYRAQRMIALGKRRRGLQLMKALDNLSYFTDFEDRHEHTLTLIAKRVRGKEA